MSYTEDLRKRVQAQFTVCPTCGHATTSKTKAASEIGITFVTFQNFLEGKSVNSKTIDALEVWVAKRK